MFFKQVQSTVKKYGLIRKGERIIVGVSGGPDSVALLYALKYLSRDLRLSLHVAHLDHMMRRDSGKDREFVESLARAFKVPVTSAAVNVPLLARKGSIEEIARNARLGFLFRVAGENKSHTIALGHTLDDQAETVLMRMLRGAGMYGLSGILPKRVIRGYTVIRPLLEVRRAEIERFLKDRKVKPRIDSSNSQELYLRNKIRKRLLPLLESQYNGNIKSVLSGMAATMGQDYDYMCRRADQALRAMGPKLKTASLLRLHPAVRRTALRLALSRFSGDLRRITFQHMLEIEDLLVNRPVRSIVDLPKGIAVVKKKDAIQLRRR